MAKPLALVVDDEEQMLAIVTFALNTQGFDTRTAGDVAQAWNLLSTTKFDLVVLDIMLPHGSGLDLTRRIRARSAHPPIMLLTALDAEHNRIAGLEAGADDYVTKPFSPRELALRAEAIYRRTATNEPPKHSFGQLVATDQGVYCGADLLPLTAREADLLTVLIRYAPKPVSRTRLLNEVWGTTSLSGGADMIKTTIYRLRRKLDHHCVDDVAIATVPSGYQLVGAQLSTD
ncbi:response regulator transcription factor [Trueperella bialowiezensis]|uniref:Alkaline phosphatase synthesis transcriptional regulatory protein phoP n=1 Tax=Trueperella bialowiezensis TaxID=312285 RepID=A0A3S4V9U9_9ACTO|nr:response regulator transcription factor [Trueperella bialowiezensis]VEI12792.1 Alkaline phosphatase synthesis transcriptional regulatory protein phoP [Trueperella bialowiezensis]